MIIVVCPEPAAWLEPALANATRRGEVLLIAPWALRIPPRGPAFLRRRVLPRHESVAVRTLPAGLGLVAELSRRALAGRNIGRAFAHVAGRRAAIDALTARAITRLRPTLLYAPSGCALRCFAAAEKTGCERILIEDWPGLRLLHADLDRAARQYPTAAFLRNFRAPHSAVARQEVEWELSTRLAVRGHYAARQRVAAGIAETAIDSSWLSLAPGAQPLLPLPRGDKIRVVLAGLAAARHGTHLLLEALARAPQLELHVRVGEGSEPRDLLQHPRVIARNSAGLSEYDAVTCPAWCESYPSEIAQAAQLGLPVFSTTAASGMHEGYETPHAAVDALVNWALRAN